MAEELRREIAQSTGVGLPWFSDKFEKLSFLWDANKEIEMSGVPDVEIDMATIQQLNEKTTKNMQSSDEAEVHVDPNWNFEISEWDDTCLKETSTTFTNKIFETLTTNTNTDSKSGNHGNGWLLDDESSACNNPKTLFIDPNDMEFFGDDIIDTDEEEASFAPKKAAPVKKSDQEPTKNKAVYQEEFNDDDEFDDENDDEFYDVDPTPKTLKPDELKLKFTIDLNTLKADMKKKSAKLISKLSVNSNNCYLVKSLVKSEQQATAVTSHMCEDLTRDAEESKQLNLLPNDFASLSNFNIADELASNLENFKLNGNLSILEMSQLKGVDKSPLADFDLACDVELNDWLSNIEFKYDASMKLECIKVLDAFKNQLLNKHQVHFYYHRILFF